MYAHSIVFFKVILMYRVPAVVQWVKNPTAVAQVAVEAWLSSLTQHSCVKSSGIVAAAEQGAAEAWTDSLAQEILYGTGVAK